MIEETVVISYTGLEHSLFPFARLRNLIIYGALVRIFKKFLAQFWGLVRPSLNTDCSHLINLKSKT